VKGLSSIDFKYNDLVEGWVLYFDRLLKDRGRGTGKDMKRLSALGYEEEAVKLLLDKRWRSAVPLTCAWLAQRNVICTSRKNPDVARTLENAYSRVEIRQAQWKISGRGELDHSPSA